MQILPDIAQVSEDNESFKDQRQKICDEAKSMMKLFPTSTFALELLGKDFIQSLITARECKLVIADINP